MPPRRALIFLCSYLKPPDSKVTSAKLQDVHMTLHTPLKLGSSHFKIGMVIVLEGKSSHRTWIVLQTGRDSTRIFFLRCFPSECHSVPSCEDQLLYKIMEEFSMKRGAPTLGLKNLRAFHECRFLDTRWPQIYGCVIFGGYPFLPALKGMHKMPPFFGFP